MQSLFGSTHAGPNADMRPLGSDYQTRCDSCGVKAQTKYAAFHQHIGAIVLMFHQRYRGNMCRECIDSTFRRVAMTVRPAWMGSSTG